MATILVIDQDEAVRVALDVLLSNQGHVVIASHASVPALGVSSKRKIDLVVSELDFGAGLSADGAGIDLFHALRTRDSELPFIFITGRDSSRDLQKLLDEQPGVRHLMKPWHNDQLLLMAEVLLERRTTSKGEGEPNPGPQQIERALMHSRGVIDQAARELGITGEMLHGLMQKHDHRRH